jgi:hypothetical protein
VSQPHLSPDLVTNVDERHGKIPTLKISLIQIFRAHLWQKSEQVSSPSKTAVLTNV